MHLRAIANYLPSTVKTSKMTSKTPPFNASNGRLSTAPTVVDYTSRPASAAMQSPFSSSENLKKPRGYANVDLENGQMGKYNLRQQGSVSSAKTDRDTELEAFPNTTELKNADPDLVTWYLTSPLTLEISKC